MTTSKASTTAPQQLVLEAAIVLAEAVSQTYPNEIIRMIRDISRTALTKFSVSTVERVKAHSWAAEEALRFGNGLDDGWTETKANDYLALSSYLNSIGVGEVVSDWHLDSYPLYQDLCQPNDGGEYPKERLSQIAALYTVTGKMVDDSEQNPYHYTGTNGRVSCFYIINPELRDLVLHPSYGYAREAVVNVIKDDNTFDPQRIRQILDFGVTSLRAGVL